MIELLKQKRNELRQKPRKVLELAESFTSGMC
jgi:hypothetical protein